MEREIAGEPQEVYPKSQSFTGLYPISYKA